MKSSNPSYQPMYCVIKWGIQFIKSIINFFNYLKTFIEQATREKNN